MDTRRNATDPRALETPDDSHSRSARPSRDRRASALLLTVAALALGSCAEGAVTGGDDGGAQPDQGGTGIGDDEWGEDQDADMGGGWDDVPVASPDAIPDLDTYYPGEDASGTDDDAPVEPMDGFVSPDDSGIVIGPMDSGTPPPTDSGTPPPDGGSGPPPVALPTPIRYLVVLTKENHTFDNMFFNFPGQSTPPPARARNSSGRTINLAHATLPFTVLHQLGHPHQLAGPGHTHRQAINSYHGGRMDSFDQPSVGNLPYYHYPAAQVRNYWAYARTFVLADNYFSTFMGPSLPGHLSVVFGYSPTLGNINCPVGATCPADSCDPTTRARVDTFNDLTCHEASTPVRPCFGIHSTVDNLPAGITWRVYGNSPLHVERGLHESHALASHQRAVAQLVSDLAHGDMANVTYIDNWPAGTSEHPPEHPCRGESYTVQIINAIIAGGHWNETAIVIGYDDWGGWYDHIQPHPSQCDTANDGPYDPGFRLPLLIVSPYAKRGSGSGGGFVFHGRSEQASVARLVAELFHRPGASPTFLEDSNPHARDRDAGSLMGAFDFHQSPRPPLVLVPRTDCPPNPPTS